MRVKFPSGFNEVKKNIIHEYSQISFIGVPKSVLEKQKMSAALSDDKQLRPIELSCRSPFKQDKYSLLNYDQDSDEELLDLNGEHLSDEQESDNDSIAHSAVEDGFIVADDDFSETSFEMTQSQADHKKIEKMLKRENKSILDKTR